jgi:uncharacterized protein (TIGR03435 family)
MMRAFRLATTAILFALQSLAQTPGVPRPAFEVASIKPYTDPGGPGPHLVGFSNKPGSPRMDMTGVTFKMLMAYAYAVRDFQIIGGPAWITSDQYDIQAKAEDGVILATTGMRDRNVPDPMALRIQSLLDDRFKLKSHRETRDLPVYELALAKGGSKLKLSADQAPPQQGGPAEPGSLFTQRSSSGWTMQATGVPLSSLMSALSELTGRPVVDRSELKAGLYDAKLQWTENGDPGPAAADSEQLSIFTALQQQLGLRLVSSKGPVQVLVIDTVQKPSEN